MIRNKLISVLIAVFIVLQPISIGMAVEPISFVMQLTRNGDNYGHRRAFLQIDKVLTDLGDKKLKN